ncbi:hypothetical protein ANCDUO_09194 [Ancylostoma duodenale]|uniref:Uncharacterized protein n=1 Tax=Ancylostoma duodenale TaxID=51022 RepID=A0A0C2GTR5_9BILA|nr:hypothetical protein ANCDUO_09194 [Ancylostoma duodenale]
MTTCTFNARNGFDDAGQEDQVRRHRTDREEETPATQRYLWHWKELFLGTCDSRGVGGVGVLVNTKLFMNIDSFEQLTTRIGCSRLR